MTCVLKRRFGPQVSDSDPDITPPSVTTPDWTPTTEVVLTWPYVSPSLTLTIRAPDIGDDHSLHLKRANNVSRGGTIMYFRDPNWPVAEILKVGFSGLCDDDVPLIFEFLSSSLGDEIGFVDWLSQTWRGVIIDPTGHLVESGIQDDNMMSFDFRGVLV